MIETEEPPWERQKICRWRLEREVFDRLYRGRESV